MNYKKLANEARKLYRAFRDEAFTCDEAYKLTKSCVEEFPIFREMIEEETEEVKGPEIVAFICFKDGSKIPVEKINVSDQDTSFYRTSDCWYKRTAVYYNNPMSFETQTCYRYFKGDDVSGWSAVSDIRGVEYIKELNT